MANWRDIDEVTVGWAGKPELGYLRCEVLSRYGDDPLTLRETHPVKLVRWAHGKPSKVAYCHSEERYVFLSRR